MRERLELTPGGGGQERAPLAGGGWGGSAEQRAQPSRLRPPGSPPPRPQASPAVCTRSRFPAKAWSPQSSGSLEKLKCPAWLWGLGAFGAPMGAEASLCPPWRRTASPGGAGGMEKAPLGKPGAGCPGRASAGQRERSRLIAPLRAKQLRSRWGCPAPAWTARARPGRPQELTPGPAAARGERASRAELSGASRPQRPSSPRPAVDSPSRPAEDRGGMGV